MIKQPLWKEVHNRVVTAKGYRLWRNKETSLYIMTSNQSTYPPSDDNAGGYYNLVELLKTKGI